MTGANAAAGGAPTRWVGESELDQLRVRRFERLQLAEESVVFGVADRRRIEHVVTMVRVLDLGAQRLRARLPAAASLPSMQNNRNASGPPAGIPRAAIVRWMLLELLADRLERRLADRLPVVVDQHSPERVLELVSEVDEAAERGCARAQPAECRIVR